MKKICVKQIISEEKMKRVFEGIYRNDEKMLSALSFSSKSSVDFITPQD